MAGGNENLPLADARSGWPGFARFAARRPGAIVTSATGGHLVRTRRRRILRTAGRRSNPVNGGRIRQLFYAPERRS